MTLSATGHAEAAALARCFAGRPIAAVYASPLERARQTAQPIAAALGREVAVEAGLDEVDFGAWTGASFAALHADPRWGRWNRLRGLAEPPGGERIAAVQARMMACLDALAARHGDAELVAVGHGDPIKAALLGYLGAPLDPMQRLVLDAGSISTVELGAEAVRVLAVNLPAAAARAGG